MFIRLTLVVASCMIVLVACSKETKDAADAFSTLKGLSEGVQDASKSADKMEQIRKSRAERGDTISLPAEEIVKFLPASIDGYTSEQPETESVDMMGMAYTKASRTYTSPDKGNVEISLMDYNGAYGTYTMSSAIFALKFHVDNSKETSGTFQTDNELVNGHETFDKSSHDVTVIYGVGGRFWLEIHAANQTGTEWAKRIAKSMDLNKLASM